MCSSEINRAKRLYTDVIIVFFELIENYSPIERGSDEFPFIMETSVIDCETMVIDGVYKLPCILTGMDKNRMIPPRAYDIR